MVWQAAKPRPNQRRSRQIAREIGLCHTLPSDDATYLETERASLAVGLDEDLLDTFTRLFANNGEAVVPLEHETCMGCHMKVTTQTVVKVKGQREIVHCEQCGRILYRGE